MNLSKSKIFLIFLLSLIVGIFIGRYVNIDIAAIFAAFFIMLLGVFWKDKAWRVVGLAGVIFCLGIVRFNLSVDKNDYQPYTGRTVQIIGVVAEDPDVRTDKTLLTLNQLNIDGVDVLGKILLTTGRFPEFSYGDQISFRGKIQFPKDAESVHEFSYKNYLSRFGIWGTAFSYEVNILGQGKFSPLKSRLIGLKHGFVEKISQNLPEPQNSFLAGLLVGMRRSIPKDITDNFATTGVTHIIALSGYNITIIAFALEHLLAFFGVRRKTAFILSLVFIAMFVIMSGASASVVRAGIMGAMILIATNIGRLFHATNALVFTGAVMLLHNPQILHFDVGFQLSFMSFAGLVYFVPILEKSWYRLPKFLTLYLFPTVAAQVFTVPLVLYYFGRFSTVSVLANILILPTIPFIMGWGFVAGFFAFISSYLALPLLWFCWAMLTYILKITEFFAKLPFASLAIESIPLWLMVAYYFFLLVYMLRLTPNFLIKYLRSWKSIPRN